MLTKLEKKKNVIVTRQRALLIKRGFEGPVFAPFFRGSHAMGSGETGMQLTTEYTTIYLNNRVAAKRVTMHCI